jgi:hypothetical protein
MLKTFRCSEVYSFDNTKLSIRHKHPSEINVHLQLIRTNQLALHRFFTRAFILPINTSIGPRPFFPVLYSRIDFTPFIFSLSLIDPPASQSFTPRVYQVICLPPLPERYPPLIPSAWYCLLHRILPYRSFLRRTNLEYLNSLLARFALSLGTFLIILSLPVSCNWKYRILVDTSILKRLSFH